VHPALEAAYAKRDRAREHLETLEDEADEFLRGYPYRVGIEIDAESRWYTAYLKVVEEPPPRLGILVGEIAYECLSALNHLVWELAARKNGRRKVLKLKRSIQFPVCSSPRHFASQTLVKDRLVSAAALTEIQWLQPYLTPYRYSPRRPNASLGWIKDIADADKHRVLARGFGEIRVDDLDWLWDETRASGPIEESLVAPWDGPFEDETKLGRIRFEVGHHKTTVDVDRQPGADILFDTGSEQIRIRHMEAAWTWLDQMALPLLAPLFPE
jgi:hypothetical protein